MLCSCKSWIGYLIGFGITLEIFFFNSIIRTQNSSLNQHWSNASQIWIPENFNSAEIIRSSRSSSDQCSNDWLLSESSSFPNRQRVLVILLGNLTESSASVENLCSQLFGGAKKYSLVVVTFLVTDDSQVRSFEGKCGTIVTLNHGQVKNLAYVKTWLPLMNSKLFDFMLVLDPSVRLLNGPDCLAKIMSQSSKLTVFCHRSLIEKRGRWSIGSDVVSSKALFGPVSVIKSLFDFVGNSSTFQFKFDEFVRQNQGSTVQKVYIGYDPKTDRCERLLKSGFVFTSSISGIVPTTANGILQVQSDEVSNELLRTRVRQDKARNVASSILSYFHRPMAEFDGARFVSSSCHYKIGDVDTGQRCNGLGDRLRGTVTALYLAIALDRFFVIDWVNPGNISEYFAIGTSPSNVGYELLFENATKIKRHFFSGHFSETEMLYQWSIFQPKLEQAYQRIEIVGNRYASLEGLFRNEFLFAKLRKALPQVVPGDRSGPEDFLPLISGAFQAIISKPNGKLQLLIDEIVDRTVGETLYMNSTKIGVQIRTEILDAYLGKKVRSEQIQYFVDEIRRIVKLKMRRSNLPVVVFVTSDWPESFPKVSKSLGSEPDVTVFSTDMYPDLITSHLENASPSGQETWFAGAKSFVDWHFLTQMDYLVISRSGFGESAALFSLVPTRRFMHQQNIFEDYYEYQTTLLQSPGDIEIYDVL